MFSAPFFLSFVLLCPFHCIVLLNNMVNKCLCRVVNTSEMAKIGTKSDVGSRKELNLM